MAYFSCAVIFFCYSRKSPPVSPGRAAKKPSVVLKARSGGYGSDDDDGEDENERLARQQVLGAFQKEKKPRASTGGPDGAKLRV